MEFRSLQRFYFHFRLTVLLEHSFIIKPRYEFVSCGDVTKIWNKYSEVTAALKDKEVLAALVPLSLSGKHIINILPCQYFSVCLYVYCTHFCTWFLNNLALFTKGGLSLDQSWVSAVLYGLLNMCTAEKLGSQKSLQLLNELFKTFNTFTVQSFVNPSCASALLNADEWVLYVLNFRTAENVDWIVSLDDLLFYFTAPFPGSIWLMHRLIKLRCLIWCREIKSCKTAFQSHSTICFQIRKKDHKMFDRGDQLCNTTSYFFSRVYVSSVTYNLSHSVYL